MVNKYIEFFCNVDSFLYLEFLFYHIFYADNCHIADKKIFPLDLMMKYVQFQVKKKG